MRSAAAIDAAVRAKQVDLAFKAEFLSKVFYGVSTSPRVFAAYLHSNRFTYEEIGVLFDVTRERARALVIEGMTPGAPL